MADPDVLPYFGLEKVSDRSLSRKVAKTDQSFSAIQARYQNFLERNGLVDKIQNLDWMCAMLEGSVTELAAYGYFEDKG